MIHKEILLNPEVPDVKLITYLLSPSREVKPGEKKPAVIVCPGGAYQFLSDKEGEPIALKYNSEGFHSFVFCYHVGTDSYTKQPQPVIDLAKAVLVIKQHAEEWEVDPDKISICGFSAGGHLCAMYSSLWKEKWLYKICGCKSEDLKISAAVLAYPMADYVLVENMRRKNPTDLMDQVNAAMTGTADPDMEVVEKCSPLSYVNKDTVPCFIWHTYQDELLDVRNSMHFAERLAECQVPFELHIYEEGKHGLALACEATDCEKQEKERTAVEWFHDMICFLRRGRA